jgi:hypothetical protein
MHGNVHGEHSKDEAKRNMLDRVKLRSAASKP